MNSMSQVYNSWYFYQAFLQIDYIGAFYSSSEFIESVISSFAFLNSFKPLPKPLAISGIFFAPNKSNSANTINSKELTSTTDELNNFPTKELNKNNQQIANTVKKFHKPNKRLIFYRFLIGGNLGTL